MGGISRHHYEVIGVGGYRTRVDVKQHLVAGVVDLQKQPHRFAGSAFVIAIGGCTEQGKAAVILLEEAKALNLLGVNDARQHEGGTV